MDHRAARGCQGAATHIPASRPQGPASSHLSGEAQGGNSTSRQVWCPGSISRKRGGMVAAAPCMGSGTRARTGCEPMLPLRGHGQRLGEQGAQSTASHTSATPCSSCGLNEEMLCALVLQRIQKEEKNPPGKTERRQEAHALSFCLSPRGKPLTLPPPTESLFNFYFTNLFNFLSQSS